MKKNKVVFAVIVAALSITCYSTYHIYSANKMTYSSQILDNVEALTAPQEGLPKDYDSKEETLVSRYTKVMGPNGTIIDTLIGYEHSIFCHGVGQLKCREDFDIHSVENPNVCTLSD